MNWDDLSASDKTGAGSVSIDNLYPAIVQCFVIILLGYVAGRTGIISTSQGAGLAAFISKFCLPSLLFVSMCELNFGSVNWMFLLGVLISKAAVFVLVAVVTMIAKRPVNLGYAGIFAIFATQSNDFALGYPIVQALYGQSNPGYLKYIYLVAPISLAILNPIGFTMMEVHKHRHAAKLQRSSGGNDQVEGEGESTTTMRQVVWNVIKGVVTNPIMFMTVIGIAGNFAFQGSVPGVLKKILTVLGDAYSGGALFYLGMSMVGKIRAQLGLGLLVPVLLIAAKGILLPLISWEVIDSLEPADNGTTSYSMYGFLYGTIPTAPSLVLYASHFDVAQNIIATGLVLGTFLSAPLMFVSAKMMTVIVMSDTNYRELLHETAFDVSIISIISGVWVLGIFFVSGKWQRIPHRFSMSLLIAHMLSCLGMVLYKSLGEHQLSGASLYPVMILILVGVFSARCWTAVVALVLCLLRVRSLCFVLRIQMWLYFAGFGLPLVVTGLIFMIGSHDIDNEIGPSFHYGNLQTVASLVILILCLVVTIVSIVLWQRAERHWSHASTSSSLSYKSLQQKDGDKRPKSYGASNACTNPTDYDQGADEFSGNATVQVESPSPDRSANVSRNGNIRRAKSIEDLMTAGPGYLDAESASADSSSGNGSINNALMENISERTCLLGRCSAERRHACMDRLRTYAATVPLDDPSPHEEEVKTQQELQHEEYQTGHHLILLLVLTLSLFFGIFLCAWKLLHNNISGIFVEIEFMDVVLNYGQGFILFTVFGFDSKLVFSPVMRRRMSKYRIVYMTYIRLRRLIYGAEVLHLPKVTELSTETMQTCQQFREYHKENCMREIVKDRRFRFKTFKDVFTGEAMCDWLIRAGLVSTRKDGVAYGQHLLFGRIIAHISGEFHFHDAPHFYKFIDKYEQLSC